jgi:hypothetical protein
MPNPVTFQIKPKSIPEVKFEEHLVSAQDREEAKRRVDSRWRYAIGSFAIGIVTLFISVIIWWSIVPHDGRVHQSALIVAGIVIGIPWLFNKVISEFAFEKEVREITSARLNATRKTNNCSCSQRLPVCFNLRTTENHERRCRRISQYTGSDYTFGK